MIILSKNILIDKVFFVFIVLILFSCNNKKKNEEEDRKSFSGTPYVEGSKPKTSSTKKNEVIAQSDRYLSLEDSLIPLFELPLYSKGVLTITEMSNFPIEQINPKAKPFIKRFILDNFKTKPLESVCASFYLGFVAEKDDLVFIENLWTDFLKNGHTEFKNNSFFASYLGSFAGVLLQRNVEGAAEFALKLSAKNFWLPDDKTNFSIPEIRNAQDCAANFAMACYSVSLFSPIWPSVEEKWVDTGKYIWGSVLKPLKEKKKSDFEEWVSHPKLTVEELEESRKKWLPELKKLMGASLDEELTINTEPYPDHPDAMVEADNSSAEKFFPLDEHSASFIEGICQEAVAQFDSISQKMLESKDPIELLPFLLDNQNTVSEKEIAKLTADEDQRKEFAEDMRRTVEVVGIARENFREKMTNFRVEMRVRTIPIPYDEKKFGEISAEEDIVVTFDLPGSGKVVKEKLGLDTTRFDNATISNPDSDLRVYMRRINGKWYWNPFNW